jgi:flagellar FliJ protein
MASNSALVRVKENQVAQHLRVVAQMSATIADFELLADSLNLQICAEEDRTKNHDPSHFVYSTLAKTALQRRDNLKWSIEDLKVQLDAAKKALHEATEEMDAVARLAEIDKIREQSKIISRERRAQVGIMNHAI